MEFLNKIDSYLSVLHTNPYVSAPLNLFLVLYAGLAAPALPPAIAGLFEHTLFKVFVLFLILGVRKYSNSMAILMAVGFFISMQTLSKYRTFTMANQFGQIINNKQTEQAQAQETESSGDDNTIDTESSADEEDGPVGSNGNGLASVEAVQNEVGTVETVPQVESQMVPTKAPVYQVASRLHPDGRYSGPQGLQTPNGYRGDELAAYGTQGSQL